MSIFWTPGTKTPQLGLAAKSAAIDRAFSHGILPEGISAWEDLQMTDEPLGKQVEALGNLIDGISGSVNVCIPPTYKDKIPVHGFWSQGLIKLASGIALSAYRDAGYFAPIDEEAIEMGSLFAELGGVPDMYGISTHEDTALVDLVETLVEAQDLHAVSAEVNPSKLRTVMHIGAGCTRHYLQTALEQAA